MRYGVQYTGLSILDYSEDIVIALFERDENFRNDNGACRKPVDVKQNQMAIKYTCKSCR